MPDEREFGRLLSDVQHLTKSVEDLADRVEKLTAAMEQAKGGWKVLVAVGSAAGAVGAVAAKLVTFKFGGAA